MEVSYIHYHTKKGQTLALVWHKLVTRKVSIRNVTKKVVRLVVRCNLKKKLVVRTFTPPQHFILREVRAILVC